MSKQSYSPNAQFQRMIGIFELVIGAAMIGFAYYSEQDMLDFYAHSSLRYQPSFSNTHRIMMGFGAFAAIFGIVWIIRAHFINKKDKALSAAIVNMADDSPRVTPDDFLRNKSAFLADGDYTGVYVIHNESKDMYYVGQSVRVIGRVTQHFTGHGNGDVYADYKYGNDFTIKTIPLVGSGYDSLDALERVTISTYDAYNRGYNRTRGNRN